MSSVTAKALFDEATTRRSEAVAYEDKCLCERERIVALRRWTNLKIDESDGGRTGVNFHRDHDQEQQPRTTMDAYDIPRTVWRAAEVHATVENALDLASAVFIETFHKRPSFLDSQWDLETHFHTNYCKSMLAYLKERGYKVELYHQMQRMLSQRDGAKYDDDWRRYRTMADRHNPVIEEDRDDEFVNSDVMLSARIAWVVHGYVRKIENIEHMADFLLTIAGDQHHRSRITALGSDGYNQRSGRHWKRKVDLGEDGGKVGTFAFHGRMLYLMSRIPPIMRDALIVCANRLPLAVRDPASVPKEDHMFRGESWIPPQWRLDEVQSYDVSPWLRDEINETMEELEDVSDERSGLIGRAESVVVEREIKRLYDDIHQRSMAESHKYNAAHAQEECEELQKEYDVLTRTHLFVKKQLDAAKLYVQTSAKKRKQEWETLQDERLSTAMQDVAIAYASDDEDDE